MFIRKRHWLLSAAFFLLCASSAQAYNQNPNLNWGNTNIIDAMIPPPGLYLSNYVVYYTSHEFKDGSGRDLPFDNDLDVLVYAPQLIYVSGFKLPWNLRLGIQALLPIQNYGLDSAVLRENNSVLGDLCIGPFIGRAVPLAKDWVLHWYFEFDTYIPIGDYDKDKNLNPSANYWTLEPYLSFTLQMPYGFTFSTRQHLTFNTENNDFRLPTGQTVDLEAGSMWHFNYSLMKTVDFMDPNLRVGAVGYYGRQFEEDEISGTHMDNSEERVFAVGPAIHWIYKGYVFSFKAYFESSVENRPEGERYTLRVIIPF